MSLLFSFSTLALIYSISSAQQDIEHGDRRSHTHSYIFKSDDSEQFTRLNYNVTKCPDSRYIEVKGAVFVRHSETNVTIYFKSYEEFYPFLRTLAPGAIVFSHHAKYCSITGKPFLLRLDSIEPLDEEPAVTIAGEAVSPTDVFRDAQVDFQSNILDLMHPEDFSARDNASTCMVQSADEPIRKGFFDWFASSISPQSAATGNCSQTPKALASYSSGPTKLIRPTKPWHIAFPNRPLRRQNFFRWMCSSCNITIFPSVRFQLKIDEYQLQRLTVVIEGTALFAMSPELRLDFYYTKLKRTIGSYAWKPLYVTIGGIPFEIQPKVRLDLRVLALVNVITPLKLTTIHGGSFEAGVEYTQQTGLTRVGTANFVAVPQDFKILLGHTFATLTGPSITDMSVHECAQKCESMKSCVGFRYQSTLRNCTLTTTARIQSSKGRASDWTFQKSQWTPPAFHPQLTGAVRIMLQPIITIDINRVGGPVLSIASGTAMTFLRADSGGISFLEIHGHIHFYVGGLVYLRIGSRKLFNKECLPEILRVSVYRVRAPKQLSIKFPKGVLAHVRESERRGFLTSTDLTALIDEALERRPTGALDESEGVFRFAELDATRRSSYVSTTLVRGAWMTVSIVFDTHDANNVSVTFSASNATGLGGETAQFRISDRGTTSLNLKKITSARDAESASCIPSALVVHRHIDSSSFSLFHPGAFATHMHFRRSASNAFLELGETLSRGEALLSDETEMSITQSGEIRFCPHASSVCFTKRFSRPVHSLAFDMDGCAHFTDSDGRLLGSYRSQYDQPARFLVPTQQNSIALYATRAFDSIAGEITFDEQTENARERYSQRQKNHFQIHCGESLYPGEALLGEDCALFVGTDGLKLFQWNTNFTTVETVWQSPQCTCESLTYSADGVLSLHCMNRTSTWSVRPSDRSATSATVKDKSVIFRHEEQLISKHSLVGTDKSLWIRRVCRAAIKWIHSCLFREGHRSDALS